MCRCTDCGFPSSRLLTISLFSAFDMVGKKGPCSCPRQFLGAVFSLNMGNINIERGSVAEE